MKTYTVYLGLMAGLLCSIGTNSFAEDQLFLEGFPDVPLLESLIEDEDNRVVFDTPSGTVAETMIRAEIQGRKVLNLYETKLVPFGWQCQRHPTSLTCIREKDRLLFLDKNPAAKNGIIILRLEPLE